MVLLRRCLVVLIMLSLVVTFAVLAFAAISLTSHEAYLSSDPFAARSFDPVAWARSDRMEDRAPMVRDLINNHLQPGVRATEVRLLLGGRPGVVEGLAVDGWGYRMQGKRTLVYGLGGWSDFRLDTAVLYIHFDERDRVIAAVIGGG